MIRITDKIKRNKKLSIFIVLLLVIPLIIAVVYFQQSLNAQAKLDKITAENARLNNQLLLTTKSFEELKNQDQIKVNQQLKADVDRINKNYKGSIEAFQKMQDLKDQKQDTKDMESVYISVVKSLADLNYASAEPTLKELNDKITKKNEELAIAQAAAAAKLANTQPVITTSGGTQTAPVATSNTPPGSGYSFQSVKADIGTYNVSIVAADLGSTRVIVDTASDSDCSDNCPVMSVGDYVARSGAFAGINGSYFCPASYPSCAGKTNSFDTLLMNKNKKYFNSDNNVYSNVPVAVFGSGYARFIGASSGWGRDTGVDGVIANQPLLLSGGNITFGGGSDPKQGSKGARSFVGNKGSTVYIGVVYNATVAEVAHVLKALGLENALNLDSGGSTALWSGGYKVGPGRNIPNAVLFVRR
jgi:exopolysaccharide biosynthesis protein